MFEPYDNIFVYLVAGDKLSFVETHTVIQQQFDIAYDKLLAMLVDGMFQFDLNLMYAVGYDFLFLVGQVQGFTYLIGKERIILDILSQ